MGQYLRVVGWLRFASKAQLNKGLKAFAEHAAPGYYDGGSWEVGDLDAHLRLGVDLPGDFDNVERPFTEMVRHAAFGYVDYLEEGNARISPNAPPGATAKRWVPRWIDRKQAIIDPRGTSGVHVEPAAGPFGKPLQIKGSFSFADAEALARAAQETFRLPFLTQEGVREIRLGAGVFTASAKAVSLAAGVAAPVLTLREPLEEVLRAVSVKATKGSASIHGGGSSITTTVAAGGKLSTEVGKKPPPPPEGVPVVSYAEA